MENNIPTYIEWRITYLLIYYIYIHTYIYILQRDSYVVKSAKIRPFCPKNIKHSSYCHGNMTQAK